MIIYFGSVLQTYVNDLKTGFQFGNVFRKSSAYVYVVDQPQKGAVSADFPVLYGSKIRRMTYG